MKRTRLLATIIAAAMMCSAGSSVSAIVTYPKITIDEDGQLRDAENNKLLIKSDSIFKFITEEKEYLQTFTGRRFYEFKEVPSDEELAALAKEWYPSDSSFDYSTAPDYAKPSVFLIISNESDSFVLGIDKNGVTRKYDDIDPEVKYEFDGINHCIKDYSTGKVLEEFTNPVAPGAAETIKYPANGYIKLVHLGKDGITGSLIHYNGSNEEEILLSMYDSTTTYESLTGDINFDGVVDTTDLTTISLALIGDQKFAPLQDELADVDGDGKVTIADLARLQQYLSKKIDSLAPKRNFINAMNDREKLMIGYYNETISKPELPSKRPRLALKCDPFCNFNETLIVDVLMADNSFKSEDFELGCFYDHEIYRCNHFNYNYLSDEKFIVNNVNSKYQKEYRKKEEIEKFSLSEKKDDFNYYWHETAELDFSNYNKGESGTIAFTYTKYYDETRNTYLQARQFIYFCVGESGIYFSGISEDDAKKSSAFNDSLDK